MHPTLCLFIFREARPLSLTLIPSREHALSSVSVFLAPKTWVSENQLGGLKYRFDAHSIAGYVSLAMFPQLPWPPIFFSVTGRGWQGGRRPCRPVELRVSDSLCEWQEVKSKSSLRPTGNLRAAHPSRKAGVPPVSLLPPPHPARPACQ